MPPAELSHAELEKALQTLRAGISASDLHGSLSGYLCGGGRADEEDWLDALQLDMDVPGQAQHETLQRLYRECREGFEQRPVRCTPLLPDAAGTLRQRTAALIEWSRGFLGGIGLAGITVRKILSADAKEILADLGSIAAANIQWGATEDDEQAFAEVRDFVATATALLQHELADAEQTQPLH